MTDNIACDAYELASDEFVEDTYRPGDFLTRGRHWPEKGKLKRGLPHIDEICGTFKEIKYDETLKKRVMIFSMCWMPSEITYDWTFYVLKCADGTLYTGVTKNLKRRLNEHNSGGQKCAKYMRPKKRRPATVAYTEECVDRSDAYRREAWFKNLTKTKKLAVIRSG